MLKEEAKIGRGVVSYNLRQLGTRHVFSWSTLRKAIVKTATNAKIQLYVIHHKMYASVLKQHTKAIVLRSKCPLFKHQTNLPEIVQVYHEATSDECIFCLSSECEGGIQVWVMEGTDARYKKPRGEGVMASGFIFRFVHHPNFVDKPTRYVGLG